MAFDWTPQPAAAKLVHELVDEFCTQSSDIRKLAKQMLDKTGTRLIDWIDHLCLREMPASESELDELNFTIETLDDDTTVLRHGDGLFPAIVIDHEPIPCLAIKVESVCEFLFSHGIPGDGAILGQPLAPIRVANATGDVNCELKVVERHGFCNFAIEKVDAEVVCASLEHRERFKLRRRQFESDKEGFEHTRGLIDRAIRDLGVDLTCDLFFASERAYWQSRNRAARVQRRRQDALGLGWANHDHHTYRSSRENFTHLVSLLELLGFRCRERFYGGREAGWGAQVLEQPSCGITIFADVDLSPEEVTGDFGHDGLEPQDELGTVGLWCKLHGEAILQAGMHHLECQFDFDASRQQLAREGINTMAPFTDFDYLKQAFTQGEVWQVDPARIEAARRDGFISSSEADQFRANGSIGSHLEILERNDGYKGFNQTGISEIILKTDPRHRQALPQFEST